ncbi:MAG: hypothetical protein RLZZ352_335 [Pseudomonadota bacterium]
MRPVAVGEISEQIRGVSYSKGDATSAPAEGYAPVLRAGNITEFGITFEDLIFVPKRFVSEKQLLRSGDVLIAASSGSLDVVGKAALVLHDYEGAFGAFCKVLRPRKDRVEPAYFAHYFKTIEYRRKISSLAAGANINNLKNEHLDELLIPLAPLAEQRRIAVILDKADTLRTKRREALAQLDRLAQSIFVEMFGDQRPDSIGSDSITLAELVAINPRISPEERQTLLNTEVAFLPMAAVSDIERRVIVDELRPYNEVAKGYTPFKRGDLLVAKITPCYENGKMAIASELSSEYGFGSTEFHVFRFATKPLGLFVFYLLGQDWVAEAGAKSMKGAAGQRRVPADYFGSLRLKKPRSELLEIFAVRVSKIDALKESARRSLLELDGLFASLQHRAFRGEL